MSASDAAVLRKPDRWPRYADIQTLCILDRHARYRIAAVLRECAGEQYVAALGQMRSTAAGKWRTARTFNFRGDELDEIIEALERAREILS